MRYRLAGATYSVIAEKLTEDRALEYADAHDISVERARAMKKIKHVSTRTGCLRRSLLIGQLHPYNRGGHEESHPPVHLSHEPDRWDGVRYLRV